MSVIDVSKDLDALTMTMTAEFVAPVAKVWQVWENPRLLERWWGPTTHPATFALRPGRPLAESTSTPMLAPRCRCSSPMLRLKVNEPIRHAPARSASTTCQRRRS